MTHSPVESPLAPSTPGFLEALAARHNVPLKPVVKDADATLLLQVLMPSLGTLSVRSENPRLLSVYHHPPATSMGYAGAIWRPEDFVLREMDILLTDDGQWEPISYRCEGYVTKHPAELRYLSEAWADALFSEGWLDAELIALEIERPRVADSGEVQAASQFRRGCFW